MDKTKLNLYVVVVNGYPKSGKDTFVNYCLEDLTGGNLNAGEVNQALVESVFSAEHISSIDCVRNMLAEAGIDVTKKTDVDRYLLAEIGRLVEDHSNFRTRSVVNSIIGKIVDWSQHQHIYGNNIVQFVQFREAENINRFINMIGAETVGEINGHNINLFIKKVLVTSPNQVYPHNIADLDVMHTSYDVTINNIETLFDLKTKSRQFVNQLATTFIDYNPSQSKESA